MSPSRRGARRSAYGYGVFCEWRVIWYLRIRGYRILLRRFRPGRGSGELDIVACRRKTLCVVEVKARRGLSRLTADTVELLVSRRQWQRISRAAALLKTGFDGYTLRVDLAVVMGLIQVRYFSNIISIDE